MSQPAELHSTKSDFAYTMLAASTPGPCCFDQLSKEPDTMSTPAVSTADLYDEYGEALQSCDLQFRQFGGRSAVHRCGGHRPLLPGQRPAQVRSWPRPGEGQVLVVDGGGSLHSALMGDLIAALRGGARVGRRGGPRRGAGRGRAARPALGVKALGVEPAQERARTAPASVDGPVAFGGVTFRPASGSAVTTTASSCIPPDAVDDRTTVIRHATLCGVSRDDGKAAYERLRAAHLGAVRASLEDHVARLDWPPERIERYRTERLRSLLGFARERSPFHAARMGDIDPASATVDDLARLPPMVKQEAQDDWDAIVTTPDIDRGGRRAGSGRAALVLLHARPACRCSARAGRAACAGCTSGTGSSTSRSPAWPGGGRCAPSAASGTDTRPARLAVLEAGEPPHASTPLFDVATGPSMRRPS